MTAQKDTILTVPWIVAQPIYQPAQPAAPDHEPDVIASRSAPPVIASRSGEAISPVRPWAKPLLNCSLVLAVVWLAIMLWSIIDGILFADPIVRLALVLAGVPIIYLLAVAMLADPYRNVGDDIYRAFNPVAQCTPSRNTITGRPQ